MPLKICKVVQIVALRIKCWENTFGKIESKRLCSESNLFDRIYFCQLKVLLSCSNGCVVEITTNISLLTHFTFTSTNLRRKDDAFDPTLTPIADLRVPRRLRGLLAHIVQFSVSRKAMNLFTGNLQDISKSRKCPKKIP